MSPDGGQGKAGLRGTEPQGSWILAQHAAAMTSLPRRSQSPGILGVPQQALQESWGEKHLLLWVLEAPYPRLLLN